MPNWKKLIVSGSDATLNSLTVTQNISASAFTGSLQGTASIANKVTGGNTDYIPLWTGAYTFSSSLLYQTGSSVLLGSTTQHTPEAPDRFGVFAGVTDSYNLISAHGEIDNYLQLNVKNFSAGATASSDFVATADVGDEFGAYINLGINSSTYALDGAIGQALDGYLFVTGSNLLIGNTSPDKKIILFTGGGDATANARVFIDPSGSVSINTAQLDPSAPDALRVRSVPFTTTYNVITAIGETDGYAQINMKNTGSGDNVSSDIVATANNGDETTNFVNMGINGATYTGTIGGPNDSYVYSTGGHLHLGAIDPGEEIMLFVGGEDVMMTTKLTLRDNNHHELSGSLFVTGGMVISQDLTVNGTLVAEKFLTEYVTSSVIYESGSTKFGDTSDDLHQFTGSLEVLGTISGSLVLPNGLFSSSAQVDYNGIQNKPTTIATASFVEYVNIANKPALVSSSLQINTGSFSGSITTASFATTASAATSITFIPSTASFATTSSFSRSGSFATTASAATSITFTPTTASFSTTSSFASNAQLLNGTGSLTFATTGSNNFNGTQTITGSLLLTTDIVVFSGSFTTSGSFAVSGSLGVTNGITGSLFGTSSWAQNVISSSFATTASAATSITFTPTTASFATTASAATSITFTPSSASFSTTSSFATTASAATSITFIPSSASFATTASAATSITFTPVTSSYAFTASFIDGGFY